MAKAIKKIIKVQARGGSATPAPPLGPVLGQAGIDIAGFCNQFNQRTMERKGQLIPAEITVYDDRTFVFILKQPPASALIMEKVKLEKGSGEPNKNKVGKITRAQLREIAEVKMPDLNTADIDAAARMMEGTAKNMGITIEG